MRGRYAAVRLLSHPFRLGADGAVVTVEQGSDQAVAQEIGALIATIRGERQAVPAFGISDPVFSSVDLAEVTAGLALFGPLVDVTGLDVTYPDSTTERVVVSWQTPQEA